MVLSACPEISTWTSVYLSSHLEPTALYRIVVLQETSVISSNDARTHERTLQLVLVSNRCSVE